VAPRPTHGGIARRPYSGAAAHWSAYCRTPVRAHSGTTSPRPPHCGTSRRAHGGAAAHRTAYRGTSGRSSCHTAARRSSGCAAAARSVESTGATTSSIDSTTTAPETSTSTTAPTTAAPKGRRVQCQCGRQQQAQAEQGYPLHDEPPVPVYFGVAVVALAFNSNWVTPA